MAVYLSKMAATKGGSNSAIYRWSSDVISDVEEPTP